MLYYCMTCSIDLRKRVVSFVETGGSKAEASRRFSVSRQRKLDKMRLRAHVKDYPDALLRERAVLFGVTIQALSYAFKQMGIGKKKNENIWNETL